MSKEHRNEQEEASVLDTVMSALNERLKGLAFAKTEEYDEANGVYVITIKRIKDGPPCKVRVDLEL